MQQVLRIIFFVVISSLGSILSAAEIVLTKGYYGDLPGGNKLENGETLESLYGEPPGTLTIKITDGLSGSNFVSGGKGGCAPVQGNDFCFDVKIYDGANNLIDSI